MVRIKINALESFGCNLLEAIGTPPDSARQVIASLLASDRCGHTSHGMLRLPIYVRRIESGIIHPDRDPEVNEKAPSAVIIDGRNTFGQVIGRVASDELIDRGREYTVASVGIRDANHLGRVGEWAERVANEGLLFVAFVNTQGGGATVAPPGSAERRLSTNPITYGIPTFDALPYPIVLDIATSQVAHGKIRERAANDETVPSEWTVDERGDSVTDATTFEEGTGAILPLGGWAAGHKGYGMAVISELFAGFVSNSSVFGQCTTEHSNNAAAFIAIDPLQFGSKKEHEERVSYLAEHLKTTNLLPSEKRRNDRYDEILLPGEPEYRRATKNCEGMVSIPEDVLRDLEKLAAEYDIEPLPSRQ